MLLHDMRIATYNIEWFSALFDKDNNLLLENSWSRRHNVKKQAQATAIAHVLKTLDADLVLIVEAPNSGGSQSCVKALEGFAKHFGLRQSKAIIGFENTTDQELAVLYDPAKVTLQHDPQGVLSDGNQQQFAPRFDGKFLYDVNVDGKADIHTFSKPPIELAVTDKTSGKTFRLIGVHTKSKAPHGAETPAQARIISIENRRKQLAQCIWIRQRVDNHIEASDPIIVLGDLNDGPGIDGFEAMFGRSSVEIVMGEKNIENQRLTEPHAEMQMNPYQGWVMTTSRFYNKKHRRYLNALLDYIMLSQDLITPMPTWRIWHPFDDPKCFEDDTMQHALLTASDHFPVSVDLNLSGL